jgi:hypothetical protein
VLYDPAQFEPLIDEPWVPARVEDAIAAIVSDADAAFDPDALWPAHEWDGWRAALPMKNLYVGAAGVVWALAALRRVAESRLDLEGAALRALELRREKPDYQEGEALPATPEGSLFYGEVGPLLVACRLGANGLLADRLRARIRENLASETDELFWGTPGTLLAAAAMGWDDLARETADVLRARRGADGLWTQHLWGQEFQAIGASHGAVSNVRALLHVDDDAELRRETAALLAEHAVREDDLANWTTEPALQWCHGAPGVLVAAWDYLDEELLLAGAELIWEAGAHGDEKGHGICHGTSGNGFALLKAFARTGDERWLERARRHAVHALRQAERIAAANGRRRYSLFTGDVGAALFAAACLDADARYPVLDVL